MLPLISFPALPSPALRQVAASISASDQASCRLRYCVSSQTTAGVALCLPSRSADPGFADELWQNTCCEAFVATAGQSAYREFNFSPSGQWAIYDFADYRQAMRRHLPDVPPKIDCQPTADGFILTVDLSTALFGPPPWQIGLCCILKSSDASVDYRALSHASDRPDFHQRASFTLCIDHFPLL